MMKYKAIREMLDSFYKNELPKRVEDTREKVFGILDAYDAENPGLNQYQLKARQYEVISETFEPVLFDELPFFCETGVLTAYGDGKFNRGNVCSANGWLFLRNEHMFVEDDPGRYKKYKDDQRDMFYVQCGPYLDMLHFGIPMEKVFRGGLKGVYDELEEAKNRELSKEERDFFEAAQRGLLALKKVGAKPI